MGFLSQLLGSHKIHDLRKGGRLAGRQAPLIWSSGRLGGFGGEVVSSHAKTGARRDTDVNRDT
jgi:hypothetical protein